MHCGPREAISILSSPLLEQEIREENTSKADLELKADHFQYEHWLSNNLG